MANEDKKDFNSMLHDNKDMPKFQIITDQIIRICQNFKSLQTRKALKNMVEVKCILLHQSTMTR